MFAKDGQLADEIARWANDNNFDKFILKVSSVPQIPLLPPLSLYFYADRNPVRMEGPHSVKLGPQTQLQ